MTALAGQLRDSMHDVCFLPTGEGVLAADGAGALRAWIVPRQFERSPRHILAAFSVLFAGRSDGSEACWKRHFGAIHRIAIDPVGKTVASAGNDGTVSLTDLLSGVEGPQADFHAPWLVSQFRFGPHDELLWNDKNAQIAGYWPGGTSWLFNLETKVQEHWGGEPNLDSMVLTPDGREVLTGQKRGKIRICRRDPSRPGGTGTQENWDLHTTSSVSQMEFSPDGRILVVRFEEGPERLGFYDYRTRERLNRYPTRPVERRWSFALRSLARRGGGPRRLHLGSPLAGIPGA